MAHEIRENDRFGYAGEAAWHGLGTKVREGLTAEEGFEELGLGWRTVMAPVIAEVEVMGDDGPTRRRVELPAQFAHLRADSMELLGMVTDGYKPFENMDLARFADSLAGADATVKFETGGSLYGGRRIFACVKLPEVIRAGSEDVTETYVLCSNGHGGFAATHCYPTGVRVVCANTLRWSERDLTRGISFTHTGDLQSKIKAAKMALGLAREEIAKFQTQVDKLVATRLSQKELDAYLEQCADVTIGRLDTAGMSEEHKVKVAERRSKVIEAWKVNFQNERQTLAGIGGTAWAAYNAVSEWQDHERGRYLSIEESPARVASNLFGVSHREKSEVLRLALNL
jgi:phage/plasmid-like protein (TIGR03299 family)